MKKTLLFILIMSGIVLISSVFLVSSFKRSTKLIDSTVRIDVEGGHGSGVYIGNGNFLTAYHVVKDNPDVVVHDNTGTNHPATVYWISPSYDIAVVHITKSESNFAKSQLTCRQPKTGEFISAKGNPGELADLTTYGQVAESEPHNVDRWSSIVILNIAVAPGMSGGPVYDAQLKVLGIVVGVYGKYSISIMVPSKTICQLFNMRV